MQIKKNRERSKSSVDLPMNEEKLRFLEKKNFAESINPTHNSFLENAMNITSSVATDKKDSRIGKGEGKGDGAGVTSNNEVNNKEDTELVISDLDANVDENDENEVSSTPSIPSRHSLGSFGSSSGASSSFIPMKNNLQKKNQIQQNQENATPSYLLLMQYFDSDDKDNSSKQDKGIQGHMVSLLYNNIQE